MDDDFNTPQACAVIFDFVRQANKVIAENDKISVSFYNKLKKFLQDTAEGVLGIIHFGELKSSSKESLEDELIQLLINLRQSLKQEKNYSMADFIRDGMNRIKRYKGRRFL